VLEKDPVLEAALENSTKAGLPAINVAPNQGKFLQLLARLKGAQRILEIGTLGGYSTIWLARALPSTGKLITLELDPKHAEVATNNFKLAGLENIIELRLGKALDSLATLSQENQAPFDFVFIDADKQNNVGYLDWAIKLSKPGSIIIVDNVVRAGGIIEPNHADDRVQGTRALYEKMAKEKRVTVTAVQTVGSKGHDGFAMAIVN
jgi:predicted O-methyltransferase YrrM